MTNWKEHLTTQHDTKPIKMRGGQTAYVNHLHDNGEMTGFRLVRDEHPIALAWNSLGESYTHQKYDLMLVFDPRDKIVHIFWPDDRDSACISFTREDSVKDYVSLYGGHYTTHFLSEDEKPSKEAIYSCWELLRKSLLSAETYERLLSAATNRLTQPSAGLRQLDANSLAEFLKFYGLIGQISVEPEIVINPKGCVQVEWNKDDENFLVLEFQSNGDVFFSLWQNDYPTEGIKAPAAMKELIKIFNNLDERR